MWTDLFFRCSRLVSVVRSGGQSVGLWCKKWGPCHHKLSLMSCFAVEPRDAIFAGFNLVETCRQWLGGRRDCISETLFATNVFHFDGNALIHDKVMVLSYQAWIWRFCRSMHENALTIFVVSLAPICAAHNSSLGRLFWLELPSFWMQLSDLSSCDFCLQWLGTLRQRRRWGMHRKSKVSYAWVDQRSK